MMLGNLGTPVPVDGSVMDAIAAEATGQLQTSASHETLNPLVPPIVIDPNTLTTQQTQNTINSGALQAVDWSNPNAVVQAGDIIPATGDTYAGPLTTVGSIMADIGAAQGQPSSPSVGIPQWALLGGIVLLVVMVTGRR
jgi:hypothetical protein